MSGPSVPVDGTAHSHVPEITRVLLPSRSVHPPLTGNTTGNCSFLYPQLPTVTIITTPTSACIITPDFTPIHFGSTPSELLHLTTELIRQKIAALETTAELRGGCGCCEKAEKEKEKEKEQRWEVDWLKEVDARAREIIAGRRRCWSEEKTWLLEEARKKRLEQGNLGGWEAGRRERLCGGDADMRGYYRVVKTGREERRTWSE
jgi:hypothetical protein